jgi:flagellar biogenesis protein FliO
VEGELAIDSAKGHARTSANKSGKCLAVSSNELAALSRAFLLLVEVEDKVLVIGKKGKAVSSAGQGVSQGLS